MFLVFMLCLFLLFLPSFHPKCAAVQDCHKITSFVVCWTLMRGGGGGAGRVCFLFCFCFFNTLMFLSSSFSESHQKMWPLGLE